MTRADRFKGAIFLGAIGDALGSVFEGINDQNDDVYYPFGKPEINLPSPQFTDDTLFTIATLESLSSSNSINIPSLAATFLEYFNRKLFVGIGSATLMAMQGLEAGGTWDNVGRKGEFAAGNGPAMRIAPLAFVPNCTRKEVWNCTRITHQNDEAYVGALAVFLSLRASINGKWTQENHLIKGIINDLPDTLVKERLNQIETMDLTSAGKIGASGYVVDSAPLAILAASKINISSIEDIFNKLINIGGDVDTNCSIAGQIIGARIGYKAIPENLMEQIVHLNHYDLLVKSTDRFIQNFLA